MTALSTNDSIYVQVTGTTCCINGERGTVKQLLYPTPASIATRALVTLDERPAMILVELGARSGERRQHAEVASAREIDRDEFDRVTGIAEARRQMGWTW